VNRVDRFAWERTVRCRRCLPDLPRDIRLFLMYVATFMDADGGHAHPGHERVAYDLDRSVRQVGRYIKAALGAGCLVELRRGHRRGDGSTAASVYGAVLPIPVCSGHPDTQSQPDIQTSGGDGLNQTSGCPVDAPSTGHPDVTLSGAPDLSTGHPGPVHRTSGASQPDIRVSTYHEDHVRPRTTNTTTTPSEAGTRARPREAAPPGGGGEDQPTVELLERVASAWNRPVGALAVHADAVTRALRTWPADALARHLAANPGAVESATGLLGHRIAALPAGPAACGRRCCATWRAENNPTPATCITHKTPLTTAGECAACTAARADGRAAAAELQRQGRAAQAERRQRIAAACDALGWSVVHTITGQQNPRTPFAAVLLGTWLDDHGWDLDAARQHAETIKSRAAS